MPDRAQPAFRRAFLLAYGAGIILCVIGPLVLQIALIGVRPGSLGLEEVAKELGYTFTGLVVLSAIVVVHRSKRARAGFPALDTAKRTRVVVLETLFYSALFSFSAFLGLLYHAMGGPQAERYAHSFIALPTLMFLFFVPRLSAWRKAMGDKA